MRIVPILVSIVLLLCVAAGEAAEGITPQIDVFLTRLDETTYHLDIGWWGDEIDPSLGADGLHYNYQEWSGALSWVGNSQPSGMEFGSQVSWFGGHLFPTAPWYGVRSFDLRPVAGTGEFGLMGWISYIPWRYEDGVPVALDGVSVQLRYSGRRDLQIGQTLLLERLPDPVPVEESTWGRIKTTFGSVRP